MLGLVSQERGGKRNTAGRTQSIGYMLDLVSLAGNANLTLSDFVEEASLRTQGDAPRQKTITVDKV